MAQLGIDGDHSGGRFVLWPGLEDSYSEEQVKRLNNSQAQWYGAFPEPFPGFGDQLVFGGGSATITALQALRVEAVSRAVELGLGTIYPGHVQNARM